MQPRDVHCQFANASSTVQAGTSSYHLQDAIYWHHGLPVSPHPRLGLPTSIAIIRKVPSSCPPCQTTGNNLPENFSNPQSSPHPPYITFSPPPWEHQSITRLRVPSKSSRIPTRTKKIPIILLTCSLALSDFIIVLFSHCIYCIFVFFCLFLCLLSTIIVQPLAITFNKQYFIILLY